jgi:signal transduction histidine kinase
VADTGLPLADPADRVDVERHGRIVARIGFDPARTDAEVVGAGARIAAAELDNAGLRAELARRLTEVERSRTRLAEAQRDERRRIERDLHDGAQQRLLALAFELRSADLSGDPERMRTALAAGATAAQSAVRELRELANGLHPAALADGGLPAALDDLARHSPVRLRVEAESGPLDPAVEFTAWLVIGEAVVNAQKHAHASEVQVGVRQRDLALVIRVCDDGVGGANPDGPGVRGMRDRVEAAGGRLVLSSPAGHGTTVEAVLPCGS